MGGGDVGLHAREADVHACERGERGALGELGQRGELGGSGQWFRAAIHMHRPVKELWSDSDARTRPMHRFRAKIKECKT